VLIPRPETELLVETALKKITHIKKPKILDLGTGSGAIALALASERPDAKIFASDYSAKALAVAEKNAKKYNLEHQIIFIKSDWFTNIIETDFDLLISNPPYIAAKDPHLQETIRHEPQQALVADNNGMKDIESLIQNSTKHLKPEAWILLEHGYDQSEPSLKLFRDYGLVNEKTYLDLNKTPRISIAQRKV